MFTFKSNGYCCSVFLPVLFGGAVTTTPQPAICGTVHDNLYYYLVNIVIPVFYLT